MCKAGSLLPQSRRHTYIASLLRIPHVVAAVNKMDLVEYSEKVFQQIRTDFLALAAQLKLSSVQVIPVSALAGDNVVEPSTAMPWYSGPTLLDYLETVPLTITEIAGQPMRFPVQLVVRPNAEFRGFAGRVERGEVRPGQRVRALPSGQITTVKTIVTYDGDLKSASFPRSVTLDSRTRSTSAAARCSLPKGKLLRRPVRPSAPWSSGCTSSRWSPVVPTSSSTPPG